MMLKLKLMYKEIIITIIVLVLITVGNIITQNNTNKSVEEMSKHLDILKQQIENKNWDESNKKMEEIEKIWKEKNEIMAYYIEHNELEKVQTEIAKTKADVESKEAAMAAESISNCNFILEHIKDKNALKIVNIF